MTATLAAVLGCLAGLVILTVAALIGIVKQSDRRYAQMPDRPVKAEDLDDVEIRARAWRDEEIAAAMRRHPAGRRPS